MDNNGWVDWKGLKTEFGWPYSRSHTDRLIEAGIFPKAFKLRDSRYAKRLWRRSELTNFFDRPPPNGAGARMGIPSRPAS